MAYLEIRRGDVLTRATIDDFAASIGRHADNTIVINDPDLSRRHCLIEKGDGGYWVHDLGSRNGTRLNGKPVARELLKDKDIIRVGTTELRFNANGMGSSVPPQRRRRKRVVVWSVVSLAFVAGAIVTAWAAGWLGEWFADDALDAFAGPHSTASSTRPREVLPETYELLTPETLEAQANTKLGKPARARFFGSPTAGDDGSLIWELPPNGELIAIIASGSEAHGALKNEPMLLEVELCGILQARADGPGLSLQVGEIHILRAWTGRDEDLQPATRALLGRRIVIDEKLAVASADDETTDEHR